MQERRQFDVQFGSLIQSVESLHEKMDEHSAQSKIIEARLEIIERDYTRFKSFFGGVVFVLSAIWAFLISAWERMQAMLSSFFGPHT